MKYLNNILYILLLILIAFLPTLFGQSKSSGIAIISTFKSDSSLNLRDGYILDQLTAWELFLIKNKISYNVLTEKDLDAEELLEDYSCLIVPVSKSLSKFEFDNLKKYLTGGGSVLASSEIGVMDEKFQAEGWFKLDEIFGVSVLRKVPKEQMTIAHSINVNSPISAEENDPSTIMISAVDEPLEVVVNSASVQPLGYFLNSTESDDKKSTMMVYGKNGSGRFVWFGFDFTSILGNKSQVEKFHSIVSQSLNWLNSYGSARVDLWPGGFNSAAALVFDFTQPSRNISSFQKLVKDEKVKSNFILNELILEKFISENFDNNYEPVFSFGKEYFSEADNWEKTDSLLKEKFDSFSDKTGIEIRSTVLPTSKLESYHFARLSDLGLETFLSNLADKNIFPEFYETNKALTFLHPSGFENFGFTGKSKKAKTNEIVEHLITKFETVSSGSGLFILDDRNLCKKCGVELNEVYGNFISYLKNKNSWIASFTEIRNWWSFKNNSTVTLREESKNSIQVTVNNKSKYDVRDVVVRVDHKYFQNKNNLSIKESGKDVEYSVDEVTGELKILLPELKSKSAAKINISIPLTD
jgi:hypothetical protein